MLQKQNHSSNDAKGSSSDPQPQCLRGYKKNPIRKSQKGKQMSRDGSI